MERGRGAMFPDAHWPWRGPTQLVGGEGTPEGWSGGRAPRAAPAEGAQGLAELVARSVTRKSLVKRGLEAAGTLVHGEQHDGERQAVGALPLPPRQRRMVTRVRGVVRWKGHGLWVMPIEFKLSAFPCYFVQSVPRGIRSGTVTCSGSHSLAERGCELGS